MEAVKALLNEKSQLENDPDRRLRLFTSLKQQIDARAPLLPPQKQQQQRVIIGEGAGEGRLAGDLRADTSANTVNASTSGDSNNRGEAVTHDEVVLCNVLLDGVTDAWSRVRQVGIEGLLSLLFFTNSQNNNTVASQQRVTRAFLVSEVLPLVEPRWEAAGGRGRAHTRRVNNNNNAAADEGNDSDSRGSGGGNNSAWFCREGLLKLVLAAVSLVNKAEAERERARAAATNGAVTVASNNNGGPSSSSSSPLLPPQQQDRHVDPTVNAATHKNDNNTDNNNTDNSYSSSSVQAVGRVLLTTFVFPSLNDAQLPVREAAVKLLMQVVAGGHTETPENNNKNSSGSSSRTRGRKSLRGGAHGDDTADDGEMLLHFAWGYVVQKLDILTAEYIRGIEKGKSESKPAASPSAASPATSAAAAEESIYAIEGHLSALAVLQRGINDASRHDGEERTAAVSLPLSTASPLISSAAPQEQRRDLGSGAVPGSQNNVRAILKALSGHPAASVRQCVSECWFHCRLGVSRSAAAGKEKAAAAAAASSDQTFLVLLYYLLGEEEEEGEEHLSGGGADQGKKRHNGGAAAAAQGTWQEQETLLMALDNFLRKTYLPAGKSQLATAEGAAGEAEGLFARLRRLHGCRGAAPPTSPLLSASLEVLFMAALRHLACVLSSPAAANASFEVRRMAGQVLPLLVQFIVRFFQRDTDEDKYKNKNKNNINDDDAGQKEHDRTNSIRHGDDDGMRAVEDLLSLLLLAGQELGGATESPAAVAAFYRDTIQPQLWWFAVLRLYTGERTNATTGDGGGAHPLGYPLAALGRRYLQHFFSLLDSSSDRKASTSDVSKHLRLRAAHSSTTLMLMAAYCLPSIRRRRLASPAASLSPSRNAESDVADTIDGPDENEAALVGVVTSHAFWRELLGVGNNNNNNSDGSGGVSPKDVDLRFAMDLVARHAPALAGSFFSRGNDNGDHSSKDESIFQMLLSDALVSALPSHQQCMLANIARMLMHDLLFFGGGAASAAGEGQQQDDAERDESDDPQQLLTSADPRQERQQQADVNEAAARTMAQPLPPRRKLFVFSCRDAFAAPALLDGGEDLQLGYSFLHRHFPRENDLYFIRYRLAGGTAGTGNVSGGEGTSQHDPHHDEQQQQQQSQTERALAAMFDTLEAALLELYSCPATELSVVAEVRGTMVKLARWVLTGGAGGRRHPRQQQQQQQQQQLQREEGKEEEEESGKTRGAPAETAAATAVAAPPTHAAAMCAALRDAGALPRLLSALLRRLDRLLPGWESKAEKDNNGKSSSSSSSSSDWDDDDDTEADGAGGGVSFAEERVAAKHALLTISRMCACAAPTAVLTTTTTEETAVTQMNADEKVSFERIRQQLSPADGAKVEVLLSG